MQSEDLTEIRRLPLFRNMLQGSFEVLMQHAKAERFPACTQLIRQGEPANFLHVVLEGAVELSGQWNKSSCTMAVVQPVGTFILAACIKDAPYLMSARTLEPARIMRIPASDLRAVFRRDPDFAVSAITELAEGYRSIVRHAKGLKLRNSRERIAAYLLKQSQLVGEADSFVLKVEKQLIASFLGMTPENLSRAIRALEPEGVVVRGQQVRITDRARLLAFVPLDTLIDGRDPAGVVAEADLPPPQRS